MAAISLLVGYSENHGGHWICEGVAWESVCVVFVRGASGVHVRRVENGKGRVLWRLSIATVVFEKFHCATGRQ